MTLYLDASVLIPLFADDARTAAAGALVQEEDDLTTSLWGAAEFTSALNKMVRVGQLTRAEASPARVALDEWLRSIGGARSILNEDIGAADRPLRRTSTALRTPDALHLAIARRLDVPLATFDVTLADAAREIGHQVVGA